MLLWLLLFYPPHLLPGRQQGGRLRRVPVLGLQDPQSQARIPVHRLWPPTVCQNTLAKPARQPAHQGQISTGSREKAYDTQAWVLGRPVTAPGLTPTAWARVRSTPRRCRHLGSPWPLLRRWERGPCPPPSAGGLCSLAPVPGGRLPGRRKPRNRPPGVSSQCLCEV